MRLYLVPVILVVLMVGLATFQPVKKQIKEWGGEIILLDLTIKEDALGRTPMELVEQSRWTVRNGNIAQGIEELKLALSIWLNSLNVEEWMGKTNGQTYPVTSKTNSKAKEIIIFQVDMGE